MHLQITDIFRYPVKGLSADTLQTVDLVPNTCIKGDRAYAITHGSSEFDHSKPSWVPRRNFLVVAHSPLLASISCIYEESTGTVRFLRDSATLRTVDLKDTNIDVILNDFFEEYASTKQCGPFGLASLSDISMTDSPTPTISIMNTQSLLDLERVTGWCIDKARFRGNIWYDGGAAWEEQYWVGKTLNFGSCRVRITEEIVRCAAVDVDTDYGVRNLSVLKTLGQKTSNVTFGVLGVVENGGSCAVGDVISTCKEA